MTEILETPRLLLEPLVASTARTLLDSSRQPDWSDGFPSGGERRVAEWLTREDLPPAQVWPFSVYLIRERDSRMLIGGAGFHGAPRERVVEIGYGLAEPARGRGYATEACATLVTTAFVSGQVDRVVATVDEVNVKSRAVLRRCGFAEVGTDVTHWAIDRA